MRRVLVAGHDRRLAARGLVEHALVAAEAGPQLGGVGERLGVEVDRAVGASKAPGMGPEAGRVERGDVAAALRRAWPARRPGRRGRCPGGGSSRPPPAAAGCAGRPCAPCRTGSGELNSTIRSTKPGKRSARSWITGPPRSPPTQPRPARGRGGRARGRGGRGCATGTSWKPSGATSESPKPRRSGTITSKPASASGSMHLPPDALRLRPAVHEQERHAALTGAHVRLAKAPRRGEARLEAAGIDVGVSHRCGSPPCCRPGRWT